MYSNLQECIRDLEKAGQLVRVKEEVDPYLEMAEIHRRVCQVGGPAIFFERIKGSPFPAVSNLFGTIERGRFIFRKTLPTVMKLMELKKDPSRLVRKPFRYATLPFSLIKGLPKKRILGKSPVLAQKTKLSQIPQIQCWPKDGGAFVTLPLVYSESPSKGGVFNSNLGMYRVQISGNEYAQDQEVGMHYQIHRGIGVHHSEALKDNTPLKVSIFVGGPPSYTLSAVMPLPEGLPEILFSGVLGGKAFEFQRLNEHFIPSQADFCITGTISKTTKREGPFGDHLGYYSLDHEFPVLNVENVFHRKGAIWPFTVVGRPPQEDSIFGKLIHEITGEVVSSELPGVHALNAVDAAGVHPLLLAVGSERYVPYQKREPQELLTLSNSILGFGQCSLAKYLIITAKEDNPRLNINDEKSFFHHILERVDWRRDLHFQTQTTMDTLDYSSVGLNKGSKLVIAACGDPRRKLGTEIPEIANNGVVVALNLVSAGILAVQIGKEFSDYTNAIREVDDLKNCLAKELVENFPLLILCDDSSWVAKSFSNFLWTTFTKSNPSHDVYGVAEFTNFKHWGCEGSLIIDARKKPHHAPELEVDERVRKKVDNLGTKGKSLFGII